MGFVVRSFVHFRQSLNWQGRSPLPLYSFTFGLDSLSSRKCVQPVIGNVDKDKHHGINVQGKQKEKVKENRLNFPKNFPLMTHFFCFEFKENGDAIYYIKSRGNASEKKWSPNWRKFSKIIWAQNLNIDLNKDLTTKKLRIWNLKRFEILRIWDLKRIFENWFSAY